MRVGKFLGKRVVLSERAWKKCLDRVDTEAVVASGDKYYIHVKCPFCCSEARDCSKCPLDVFTPESEVRYGCVELVRQVNSQLNDGLIRSFGLSDNFVSWDKADNMEARLVLDFIHARLKRMRRRKR
jgi:hypothetical protein